MSYKVFFIVLITQEFSKETGNMSLLHWFKAEIHLVCNTWVWLKTTANFSYDLWKCEVCEQQNILSANTPICRALGPLFLSFSTPAFASVSLHIFSLTAYTTGCEIRLFLHIHKLSGKPTHTIHTNTYSAVCWLCKWAVVWILLSLATPSFLHSAFPPNCVERTGLVKIVGGVWKKY